MGLALAFMLVVAQMAAGPPAVAQGAVSTPPFASSLIGNVMGDAACAEPEVVGQCHCGLIVCGLSVRQYVPVAIVETTRAPGDSLLGLPVPLGSLFGGTASSSLSTTDNTAEVHVWSLPDGPIPGLACLGCSPSSARLPAFPQDLTAARCGPAAAVAQAMQAAAADIVGPWLPHLAYASEIDVLNWRTGCRDLLGPRSFGLPALAACVGQTSPFSMSADSNCLGAWGPLLPRQMRDIGPTPLLYSAKTAVRAMSIAREQIGSFPYPVDAEGKLQQAYPAVSACFRVGQLPLPQLPEARPAQTSADGRYAWVYWRRTTCCIGLPAARQCLRLR